jgi:hypothetical protein
MLAVTYSPNSQVIHKLQLARQKKLINPCPVGMALIPSFAYICGTRLALVSAGQS